jgi:hypothetical protein
MLTIQLKIFTIKNTFFVTPTICRVAEKLKETTLKGPQKAQVMEETASIKAIIIESLQLLKKTLFPTLGIIFLLSFIVALFALLLLVNPGWELRNVAAELQLINEYSKDPAYELPSNFQEIQFRFLQLTLYNLVITSFLQFLCPIGLLLLTTGRIYHIYTSDKDAPKTWLRSLKSPLSTPRRAFTSFTLVILLSFFVPIGIMLFFFPGILLMVYGFFQFHAYLLDEKYGRDILKGGAFYARDNFAKIVVLLFLGFFMPWLISYLISMPLVHAIGLSDLKFLEISAPETRNYGMLLVFYFVNFSIQNMFYFWFPALMCVAFVKIRTQKLQILKNLTEKKTEKKDVIKTMEIQAGQRNYNCTVCGQKLPLSAKKCNKCGQLYKMILKR